MGVQAESSSAAGVDLGTPGSSNKRKQVPDATAQHRAQVHYNLGYTPSPAKKAKRSAPTTEKRLRRFRPQPPRSFHEIYQRATTQRFFVLNRTRLGTADCPEERVELTGSTGNIYTVTIDEQPTCTCPHAEKGNQCKHWLYVLSRVLRAKFDHVYQLALVPSELREIFANAPPIATEDGAQEGKPDKNRKPIEGDCPICFMEFEIVDDKPAEPVVWCKAACGQNMHKECFAMWAATKRQGGTARSEATCPMCRSVWVGDTEMGGIRKESAVMSEGYVNVADQLGISTQRDYSTYSRWWSEHPQAYRRRRW